MYCLYKHFIILSFLAVISTNAQECSAGAQCVVVEECRRILITPNSTIDLNVIKQSSHCGFNERNQSMICCPPVLSDYPLSDSAPQPSPSYVRAAAIARAGALAWLRRHYNRYYQDITSARQPPYMNTPGWR